MKGGVIVLFRENMKKQGQTYEAMAKALGLTRLTISNWDKGITSPTLIQAKSISTLLDMDIKELFENAWKMRKDKGE